MYFENTHLNRMVFVKKGLSSKFGFKGFMPLTNFTKTFRKRDSFFYSEDPN